MSKEQEEKHEFKKQLGESMKTGANKIFERKELLKPVIQSLQQYEEFFEEQKELFYELMESAKEEILAFAKDELNEDLEPPEQSLVPVYQPPDDDDDDQEEDANLSVDSDIRPYLAADDDEGYYTSYHEDDDEQDLIRIITEQLDAKIGWDLKQMKVGRTLLFELVTLLYRCIRDVPSERDMFSDLLDITVRAKSMTGLNLIVSQSFCKKAQSGLFHDTFPSLYRFTVIGESVQLEYGSNILENN